MATRTTKKSSPKTRSRKYARGTNESRMVDDELQGRAGERLPSYQNTPVGNEPKWERDDPVTRAQRAGRGEVKRRKSR